MHDGIDPLRALDWATGWANSCEQRFGSRLCSGCVEQGRDRCALADYARRLVAAVYGDSRSPTPRGGSQPPGRGEGA